MATSMMRSVPKTVFNHEKLGHIYRTGDLGLLSPKGYVIFWDARTFKLSCTATVSNWER